MRSAAVAEKGAALVEVIRVIYKRQPCAECDGVPPAYAGAMSREPRGPRLIVEEAEALPQAELWQSTRWQEEVGGRLCYFLAGTRLKRVHPMADRSGHGPALAHHEADAKRKRGKAKLHDDRVLLGPPAVVDH